MEPPTQTFVQDESIDIWEDEITEEDLSMYSSSSTSIFPFQPSVAPNVTRVVQMASSFTSEAPEEDEVAQFNKRAQLHLSPFESSEDDGDLEPSSDEETNKSFFNRLVILILK